MQRFVEAVGRRGFLGGIAAAGVAACPLCTAVAANGPHWSYEGHSGPEHWGDLAPEFRTCAIGAEQTPIDLASPIDAQLGGLAVDFREMPANVLNNGHTIQVNCAPGSGTTIGEKRFELLQFHFHHESEHLLSGKALPMEAHFVHKASDGALAVIGVFLTVGAANPAIETIWSVMPREEGAKAEGGMIRLADLLPADHHYFRYMGSLTTPPCTEGLLWTVFKQPMTVSKGQLDKFAALFENNARPVQPRNRRFLLGGTS